ncbi:MAG: c-type cytochrome [Steroidobacteraceae bacterium]|nr:c-type cytochrome [Steroidobacteraceae bacterium]MDW8258247.1 c-type cytochrome [Gammaproteobacteria bacterium]
MRAQWRAALALVGMALAAPLSAQETPAGDPVRGQALSYTCLGCHGIENYKNVAPVYSVPKLYGQSPQAIVDALKGYKSGERSHATMHAHAASASEQDMWDMAVYLAGPVLKPGDVKQIGTPPAAAQVCVACHGNNGISVAPNYPHLAGQHRDYLAQTLRDYKRGGRKNAVMAGFMAALKNEDIKQLATYYAAQQPGLRTVPKRVTILSQR